MGEGVRGGQGGKLRVRLPPPPRSPGGSRGVIPPVNKGRGKGSPCGPGPGPEVPGRDPGVRGEVPPSGSAAPA
eukprot:8297086-Pyramimonas_sp.AAC.1